MSGGRQATKDFLSVGNTESEENLRRILWLFKRYMLPKVAERVDTVERSELRHGLIPLKSGTGIRPPSFLEQSLLPKLCRPCEEDGPLSTDNYSTSQMTIFYGGAVHVYDDVSCDRFQCIMRVAGLTSSSPSVDLSKKKEHHGSPDSAPTTKKNSTLSAATDLPLLARRHSIQQFLEKRRHRLARHSPYAAAAASQDWHEKKLDKVQKIADLESSDGGRESAGHVGFYPAPFPSTIGFSFLKEQ